MASLIKLGKTLLLVNAIYIIVILLYVGLLQVKETDAKASSETDSLLGSKCVQDTEYNC